MILDDLAAIVGAGHVLGREQIETRAIDFWSSDATRALGLVRPASTAEVSAILALCHARGQVVIPEGGRTNLVRGTEAEPDHILLSLERMSRIGEIAADSGWVEVEAGAVLQRLQDHAAGQELRVGLDLGARGSATIGGLLAMNAGGVQVMRYGSARAQVLGLEVVLADGTVLEHLTPYAKDNTGYDLKQLFIGSEGTLGIITRAVLRLHPQPISVQTAFLAFEEFGPIPKLLGTLSRGLAGTLSSFEVIWRDFYDLNTEEGRLRAPVRRGLPYYVLCEAEGFEPEADAARFERLIVEAMEAGAVDAAIAQSVAQRDAFWRIREDFEAEMALFSEMGDFDVSLALEDMESFGRDLARAVDEQLPGHSGLHVFGHMGDGNLHVAIGLPSKDKKPIAERIVYDLVAARRGAISAEHGIGLSKRDWLGRSRSQAEIAAMAAIKSVLDPQNILNPGKIFRAAGSAPV
ncbi:FAD-binding oxidoreductase [Pseudaminobacter sp. 19-2017]|uniref:FAD-binding oxidoreductase n=1 Tax=Pseudaminobacter soli (ex Zhang et al. 2022) TaxID=2831468 RepID=A0A942DYG1_9HYPH|nr:FAD-binding oxidoreductase [Pseudaminobacter soli]MBS3650264.1 FAD-binding oxidoreductase [Pseudaminobacter soli]